MTEGIREWLTGIIAAALLLCVVYGIIPDGPVKRVGKITGGLVLMLALLRPVAGLNLETLSANLTNYRVEAGSYGENIEEANGRLMKTIIEERSAAYILERAEALGMDCKITVTCKTGEDRYPYPYEATITGSLSKEEKKTLTAMLKADLAIGADRLHWKTED